MLRDHVEPLTLKDCWITPLATSISANTLRELRDGVERAPDESLVFHFQATMLRPSFERRDFNNDFANWASESLRDPVLGERLGIVALDHQGAAGIRRELLRIIDERLNQCIDDTPALEPFQFVQGQLVVVDTGLEVHTPSALAEAIPGLPLNSVFFHVVDGRLRGEDGSGDFGRWLRKFGPETEDLCHALQKLDFRFMALPDLQNRLGLLMGQSLERGLV